MHHFLGAFRTVLPPVIELIADATAHPLFMIPSRWEVFEEPTSSRMTLFPSIELKGTWSLGFSSSCFLIRGTAWTGSRKEIRNFPSHLAKDDLIATISRTVLILAHAFFCTISPFSAAIMCLMSFYWIVICTSLSEAGRFCAIKESCKQTEFAVFGVKRAFRIENAANFRLIFSSIEFLWFTKRAKAPLNQFVNSAASSPSQHRQFWTAKHIFTLE